MSIFVLNIWTDITAFAAADPVLFYSVLTLSALVLIALCSRLVLFKARRSRQQKIVLASIEMEEADRRDKEREAERLRRIAEAEAERLRRIEEQKKAELEKAKVLAENAGDNDESQQIEQPAAAPKKRVSKKRTAKKKVEEATEVAQPDSDPVPAAESAETQSAEVQGE